MARLAVELLLPVLRLPVNFLTDPLAAITAVADPFLRLRLVVRIVIRPGNYEALPVGGCSLGKFPILRLLDVSAGSKADTPAEGRVLLLLCAILLCHTDRPRVTRLSLLRLLIPHGHRLCNHVLETVFADALHIPLVTEHLAQVFNLLLVAIACTVEQLIVFLQSFLVCR